jgi:glycosyltransferase involved in cell wall biosynthesis
MNEAAEKTECVVGYFLGVFPCLSETFIRREVAALRRQGVNLLVFAYRGADLDLLGPDERDLARETIYLPARTAWLLPLLRRLFRNPSQTLAALAFLRKRRRTLFVGVASVRRFLAQVLGLVEELERCGVEHLHSPWAFGDAATARLAAEFLALPCSLEARASDLYKRDCLPGLDEKLAESSFVITNSDYNVATIGRRLGADHRVPVRRVYEGVEIASLCPEPPRHGPLEPARILCVARITEPKGLSYLLDAARLLKERGYSFCCEVVGARVDSEEQYADEILDRRRELDLESEVRFSGPLLFAEVVERYRWADLCVLAAIESSDGRRDITPNSLIEALAMGVPIVSTRSGAIAELVDHGKSGLLVPPADARSFADAMQLLIDDQDLRHRMAHGAREAAAMRFDIDRNVQVHAELFRNSIRGGISGFSDTPGRGREAKFAPPETIVQPSFDLTRSVLGSDLAALLEQRGKIPAEIEPLVPPSPWRRGTGSFRLKFSQGEDEKGVRLDDQRRVEAVLEIMEAVDHSGIVRPTERRGGAYVQPWIVGSSLIEGPWSREIIAQAASLQGHMHRTPVREDMLRLAGREKASPWRDRLEESLEVLVAQSRLSTARRELIARIAEEHRPHTVAEGFIHKDFCAENLVRDVDGRVWVVDNESLTVGPYAYDLARTWYRWPLSAQCRSEYLEHYEAYRSARDFVEQFSYWGIVVVVRAAVLRLETDGAGAEPPLRLLESLVRDLESGMRPREAMLEARAEEHS